MNIVNKFRSGLIKTSNFLTSNIVHSITSKKINPEIIQDIETTLISADLGLEVTDHLISKIKATKIKINKPLSGSFAKVCTELRIPDLTKNVPLILNVNVVIDKIITQEVKINFFSKTKIQCKSVVNASHGIKETFSTGSQNQKPPQPNS